MKEKYRILLTGCLVLVVLSTGTTLTQAQIPEFGSDRGVTRVTSSNVSAQVFTRPAADQFLNESRSPQTEPLIRFDFFPDVSAVVKFDHIARQGPGVFAWSGKVEGIVNSSATFVVSGNLLTGSVNRGDGKVYQIRTAEDGTQWSLEIDQARFPDTDDALRQPQLESSLAAPGDSLAAADDGSEIDVLVLYTAAARIAAGGTTAIQQLVQLGIAETNTAYSNSGVIQRVRLVASRELDYTEASAGISTDLSRITSSSDVATLRNTYGADLVSLWVNTNESTCGIGWILPNTTSSPSQLARNGFSVVELDCATGVYTFGHELGHNMGATHAKGDLQDDGSAPEGVFPYSHGYKQTSGPARFRTVMSYNCSPSCPRIQYFSNPAVLYNSLPVGIDSNLPQGADNALTFNNTRNIIANYRPAITGPPSGETDIAPPLITIATPGQSVQSTSITITGTATDAGQGDNGISSVTVNGVRAVNDTATGAGVASWSRTVTLTPGTNRITVVARDASPALNSVTASITITSAPLTSSVTAATYHVFPQFADGRLNDGTSYKSTVMISNPDPTAGANCSLQLHGLTLPGFPLTYNMGANGWVIAPTSGTGTFQSGYASLQCTAPVEAQVLYSFFREDGAKSAEATVFSSPPGARAVLIADEREGAQLGLAIANDSDRTVTYTISVTNGGSGSLTLPPRTSIAKFLNQFVPSVPANNLGVVLVSSTDGMASAVGIRLSGSAFTTIPASLTSPVGATANTYHVFPQFADGRFSDGTYYRTTRLYTNPSSTESASCTSQLRGLTTDERSSFVGNLGPGSSVVAPTNGTQAFQSGYATMQCTSKVEAQVLYSYYAQNGAKLSEATVFSSPPGQIVQVLADSREGAQLGLAMANDSDQANTYTISVYDVSGNAVGTTTQQLGPRTSIAKFVNEFVPLPPNHYGQVVISGTGLVSIIGVRVTGGILTTIPATIRLAPTSPVTVGRAFTSDTNNAEKTSFLTGETVRLQMTRSNSSSSTVTVTARYAATGPSSYALTDSTVSSTVPPGTRTFFLEAPIPQNAPAGNYTFSASVTYNGVTSTQTATFLVTAGAGSTSSAVIVSGAFTSATNGTAQTSFSAGQTVRLRMTRSNNSSGPLTITARYAATGPPDYSLTNQSFTTTAPPGIDTFYVDVLIPQTAPVGDYTFTASVTYNEVTSTQTAAFTVTAGGTDRTDADSRAEPHRDSASADYPE